LAENRTGRRVWKGGGERKRMTRMRIIRKLIGKVTMEKKDVEKRNCTSIRREIGRGRKKG